MRRLLLAAASALLLTGCANAPAAPSVPELPKLATVADFTGKVGAAIREKKTASHIGPFVDPDQHTYSVRSRGSFRYEPDGSRSTLISTQDFGANPFTLITVAEGTFLTSQAGADTDTARPWLQVRDDEDPELKYFTTALAKGHSWLREPTHHLPLFGQAAKLESTVQEELSGAQAVKYTFTLDLAKAAEASTDKALKARLKARAEQGRTTARHEVWLNADHLPVRWFIEEPRPKAGPGYPATTDIQYQNWGKPVEIAAPPAKRIR